jgi:hypothetical protein
VQSAYIVQLERKQFIENVCVYGGGGGGGGNLSKLMAEPLSFVPTGRHPAAHPAPVIM